MEAFVVDSRLPPRLPTWNEITGKFAEEIWELERFRSGIAINRW